MKLILNIDYRTVFGEELLVNLVSIDEIDKNATFRMSTVDGVRWTAELTLAEKQKGSVLRYFYSVESSGKSLRHEWTLAPHVLELPVQSRARVLVFDHWHDIPEDSYLYSAAFTECINPRPTSKLALKDGKTIVRLIARAPQLKSNQRLVCVGDDDLLGNWDVSKGVQMAEHQQNEWVADVELPNKKQDKLTLKFAAIDLKNKSNVVWEWGDNRVISLPELSTGETIVYDLPQANFPISDTRIAGTLVPVFSLRTKGSFGVGDFGDLKTMIDFVAKTGQRALQVLPINDTTTTHTWTDSYPYSCISIFAIHPQYVDLRQLPQIADATERTRMELLREELNALPQIDYERVNQAKTDYLQIIFKQEWAKTKRSAGFKRFFEEEQTWLVPYAQYSLLRERYGNVEISTWHGHEQWNEADRALYSNPKTEEFEQAAFYYYTQYVLSSQMKAAHKYAQQKGVVLKGDIPIGVNRNGCDVWMEPKYFNLNGQAGAPPDDFSVNGQNWGFPTYNWDAMIADGCQWWVRRFQNMAHYFDAYRIDHVLGFFRIWEIPINSVHGLLGQFSPSLGMTREEIESYGLPFREEQYCNPFIADWTLARIFGDRAEEVKQKYLEHDHHDIWKLKEGYNTQRKIEAAFFGKTDEADLWLRDGLYALVSCVLFVRDRQDANKFHPRISAQLDFCYETLWGGDRDAFNRLYNDYYYRRNNQFWYNEAMKKLPKLVEATRMLVCAEDLGMVPDCVDWVIKQLRILSLEIQSMPKDPKTRFGYPNLYPYRSVCTISSHDMATLRQWWDEDDARTQDFYNNWLHRDGAAPHPLSGWLARDILAQNLNAPSMLAIMSIQDWLAIDEQLRLPDANAERINIPANPKHYWRYRMHVNIEDLIENKDFCDNITELIYQTGRK